MAPNPPPSPPQSKRVLIIGAGASGIAAIKCCLEEGLTPVCLEQESFIGGLWQFTPDERHSTVYKSTVINTSKELMAFSDFPIPKHYPAYMHHSQIIEYFNSYVDHFGLRKYIQFLTTVLDVAKSPDYDSTGRWTVRYSKDGVESSDEFDAVVVASGHHWKKRFPSFPGMDVFKGKQMHSHAYKDFRGFENLRVVVVGIGNSGSDVAVELSRHCKQVYLSTRSGSWILNRVADGIPADLLFNARAVSWIPISVKNKLVEPQLKKSTALENFGLQPNFSLFNAHPTVNGEILGRITVGAISVHPNIARLTEKTVVFEDGREVEADVVIYATGYEISFPYLDENAEVKVNDNQVDLFKFVFPPHHKHPTMAFIGLIQPWGAIMPISEMQMRWASRVFSGNAKLPSAKEMRENIQQTQEAMAKRYKKSPRHTIQVDYVNYMDDLAQIIGVYPSFWEILKKDRNLLRYMYLDPVVPAQYRLVGPHPWDGATQVIKSAMSRSVYPTRHTRKTNPKDFVPYHPTLMDSAKGLAVGAAILGFKALL